MLKVFFFTISIQVYATDNQSTVMEMKVELFLWIHFSYYCTNLLFTGLLLFVYCKLSDLSSQLVSQLLVRDHLRTKQDAMLLDVQDMTSWQRNKLHRTLTQTIYSLPGNLSHCTPTTVRSVCVLLRLNHLNNCSIPHNSNHARGKRHPQNSSHNVICDRRLWVGINR